MKIKCNANGIVRLQQMAMEENGGRYRAGGGGGRPRALAPCCPGGPHVDGVPCREMAR